jgi:lactocepin
VRIDNTAPVIGEVSYDKNTKLLSVAAADGDYPVLKYELVENGAVLATSNDGKFDLSLVSFTNKAFVSVYDLAYNKEDARLESIFKGEENSVPAEPTVPTVPEVPTTPAVNTEPTGPAEGDVTIPTVMVESPEFFGVFNTAELNFAGFIQDQSSLSLFKINGVDVPFVFNTETGNWEFNTTVTLEDGYHSVNVEAKDSANNEIAFAHKLFVDTKAPVINMTEQLPEDTKEATITVKAMVTDNLPSMKVLVNDNMLTNIAPDWSYFNDLAPASYVLDYVVELVDGKNTIKIEAVDDAGNITTQTFVINKIKGNKDKK